MKRNKLPALLLTLLFALVLFTACGADASYPNGGAATDTAVRPASTAAQEEDYGFTQEAADMESAASAGGSSRPADVKLIYTGNLTLQATDFSAATQGITDLVASFGGYLENQEVYRNNTYQRAYFVIRIPGDRFESFMNSVSECGGCQVIYQATSVDDVGEQYADIENRLFTLQTKLERLQELLGKAENMEDIIAIESEISNVEYEIERLSGEKNHYDSLIGYSTIYIDLDEVAILSEGVNPTLGERLSAGFASGMKGFARGCADFLVWLVSNLIGVVLFLVILAAVAAVILRRRKRRRDPQRPERPGKADDSQYQQ